MITLLAIYFRTSFITFQMVFLHKIGFKERPKGHRLEVYPYTPFAEKIRQIVFERLSYLIDGRICKQPSYGQQ